MGTDLFIFCLIAPVGAYHLCFSFRSGCLTAPAVQVKDVPAARLYKNGLHHRRDAPLVRLSLKKSEEIRDISRIYCSSLITLTSAQGLRPLCFFMYRTNLMR